MRLCKKRRSAEKAFTLSELIIALVLLSICLPALCMLVNVNIENVFIAQETTEAVNLARNEMEKTVNLGYFSVEDVFYSGYEGTNYDLQRSVEKISYSSGAGQPGLKRITVSVTSPGKDKELSVLTTDISSD